MSSILDQIKSDTVETIAAEARARGLSVDEYLKSLLHQSNGDADTKPLCETAAPEEWVSAFREWATGHPILPIADDSRESIYQDRGE